MPSSARRTLPEPTLTRPGQPMDTESNSGRRDPKRAEKENDSGIATSSATAANGGKKTAVACLTCRAKRQKCDGGQPSCKSCLAVNSTCTYPDFQKRRGPPPGYLKAIESRSTRLEAYLGFVLEARPELSKTLETLAEEFVSKHDEEDQWEDFRRTFETQLSSLGNINTHSDSRKRAKPDRSKSPPQRTRQQTDSAPELISIPTGLSNVVPSLPDLSNPNHDAWTSEWGNAFAPDTTPRQVAFTGFDTEIGFPVSEPFAPVEAPESSSTGLRRQTFEVNYTSGFWRESRFPSPELQTSANQVQLPSVDVQRRLAQVYLSVSHLPILEDDVLVADPTSLSEPLIFALCSYAACFSPTIDGMASNLNIFGGDSAGGPLAEIWAQQVWTLLMGGGLRRCDIDGVQALALLTLRELGKGEEFRAWVMLGITLRIAQDIDVYSRSPTLWNSICSLDLMLSLQLGRAPSIRESNFIQEGSTPFYQNMRLLRIVFRIQDGLYLTRDQTAERLRSDLEQWYDSLPVACRATLGRNIPSEILELHMTYYAASVLLYRPSLETHLPAALDAASAFNVFLDSYRQRTEISQAPPTLIYLVFTVALTFFLVVRRLRQTSFTASLSAQASLLKCLETLEIAGKTWPIGRRCHRVLDRLIDGEDLEALAGRPRNTNFDPLPPLFAPWEGSTGWTLSAELHEPANENDVEQLLASLLG